MVETTWQPFDTHVQQLEAEGPVTYERMVELVAMLQQQWRFVFNRNELVTAVKEAPPGIIRTELITNAINLYFEQASRYLDCISQNVPHDEVIMYEQDRTWEGYVDAIQAIVGGARQAAYWSGVGLIDELWEAGFEETREAVQDNVLKYEGTEQGRIGEAFIELSGFEYEGDLPVRNEDGRNVVRFWGRDVSLPNDIGNVHSVREMVSGHSVFVMGVDGRQHIVKVDLNGTERNGTIEGRAVSLDEFDRDYYFGEQVSRQSIRNSLYDFQFQGFLCAIAKKSINLNVTPLYGKARFRECLYDPELADPAARFLSRHGPQALYIFNSLSKEELRTLLPVMENLHTITAGEEAGDTYAEDNTVEQRLVAAVAHAYRSAFEITQAHGLNEGNYIVRLLETRLKTQLLELIPVLSKLNKDGTLSEEERMDIFFAANSFEMVCRSASAAVQAIRNEPLPVGFERLHMPADAILDVFDYIKRHSTSTAIFQAGFEFILSVMMSQEQNPLIDLKEAEKPAMYKKLAEGKKLQEVPTTDTATDTARAVSLLLDAVENQGVPKEGMRILFVGMNTAERFEKPVVEELRQAGVEFGEIIGIDQNNFLEEAKTNLDLQEGEKFSYHVGNLQEGEFPQLEREEGKVDVVVVPWSMLNDLLKTMSLAQVLYKLKGYMKDGGIMITDNPIPAGIHSYEAQIREAAQQGLPFGHVLRTLKAADEDVETMFKIYFMQYLTMHLMSLGMEPLNFPGSLAVQSQIADALSEDDSDLTFQHEQGLDRNAVDYPIYQANGANRMTLACKLVGTDEITKKHGIFPMWLYERAIKPGRKVLNDGSESDSELHLAA